jgi:hypothetical protein
MDCLPESWVPGFAEEHNAEAAAVWAAFRAGDPIRPPVFLGTNARFFLFNEELNPKGRLSFEAYTIDPQATLDFQLRAAAWRARYLAPCCDDPVGLPDKFTVKVDLQNFDEAAYFGAPVVFLDHQVPATLPILQGDRKNALFDAGLPDPLSGGWYRQAHRLCAGMRARIEREPTYLDRPIEMEPFGIYTCGPLTLAHQLRGTELLTDFYDDPGYVRQLLDFLVEGTIARIYAHRRFFGLEPISPDLFMAEDDVQLISATLLDEFVVPALKKLKAGLTSAERIKVHICGDGTRHFRTFRDELGVYEFDTGFPVGFGRLRRELGPEVTIWGGPNVMILKDGTPAQVAEETTRILESGICAGGRFVLREGNNLAPHTPRANLSAMYEAARTWKGRTD